MAPQTTVPPSKRTVAAPVDGRPTEPLEPAAAEVRLEALPLLDHRSRERTIAPHLALRGHYLEVGDGADTRLLHIDRDVTHIGRGSGSDIRLDEHRVSRDHAIMVRHGRYFRLLDNRSSNGTYVNGRRIVATNISSGDVIAIGPVRVRYVEIQ